MVFGSWKRETKRRALDAPRAAGAASPRSSDEVLRSLAREFCAMGQGLLVQRVIESRSVMSWSSMSEDFKRLERTALDDLNLMAMAQVRLQAAVDLAEVIAGEGLCDVDLGGLEKARAS